MIRNHATRSTYHVSNMQALIARLVPKRERENQTAGDVSLIVGLGNPGREYAQTRHNIGFQVVSRFAE